MSLFTTLTRIVITCQNRLTPYLDEEVRELGYTPVSKFLTGLVVSGTLTDCIRLNLNLRCASQVLYPVSSFAADDIDEIYEQVKSIPWEQYLPAAGYFSVTCVASHHSVRNSMFVNLRVKDALVDRIRDLSGIRPSSGSEKTGAVVHLFWKNNQAEVFLDTSGDSLARHGYRKIPGEAPMLEALAAATIMATKWDRISPFINPMCGAGTVAIEAALIATDRRPGLYRGNYAFMHLLGYDEKLYKKELFALDAKIKDIPELKIVATDHSELAINNARINAAAAGVEELITFSVCDFADTEVPPGESGVVLINPEYGMRLGDEDELESTYARIGDFMKKKCGGYWGYVFTGNMELAKKIGLKAKRRIEFYNSTIDCRLLEYELYSGTRREDKEALPIPPYPDTLP